MHEIHGHILRIEFSAVTHGTEMPEVTMYKN